VKRRIQGLHDADLSAASRIRDGLLLVRIERANHRWDSRKPFYLLRFSILEPKELAGHSVAGRLYCTPRGLWKLNWFLRDFGYDTDLLGRAQVDDRALVGLVGIVRTSRQTLAGRVFLNFEAFAPQSDWDLLSSTAGSSKCQPGGSI